MFKGFINKVKSDCHFRIKITLQLSFLFNIIYSVFLLTVSSIYNSNWFLVMGLYYFALSLVRIFIFLQLKYPTQLKTKIITFKIIGYYLLILNLILSTMMFILLFKIEHVKHHEITVITLATYTFTSLTMAIFSGIKYVRLNDYGLISAKIISLISASVSLVTLTDTMLCTWGENNILLRNIIMPILCAIVSFYVVFTAIFIIYKANKKLRIIKYEKTRR